MTTNTIYLIKYKTAPYKQYKLLKVQRRNLIATARWKHRKESGVFSGKEVVISLGVMYTMASY
jgi:hypothetical protein